MRKRHTLVLINDFKAGLTVGVVLVPQAVAYAIMAGLPAIYGLYASLIPLIIYAAFGTSPHLAAGVNAIDMLIIGAGVAALATPGSDVFVAMVILLAAMTGLIQLVMGLLRLGFIVNLLSRPVTTGFISGAALVIALNQFGGLFGLQLAGSSRIHELVRAFAERIDQVHLISAVIGLGAVVTIVGIQRFKPRFPSALLAVVVTTAATWLLHLENLGVAVVGPLPSGLPWPAMPGFDVGVVGDLLPTAVALALFQFMTVVSLGRAFGAKAGYRVYPNRELAAIGASNVLGSMFHAIPISGSFSRTSILFEFGLTTRRANALAAVVVGVTILFLTSVFEYVPLAVLSAIILVAISKLVDWREVWYLLRVKRSDGLIALLTFVATIFLGVLAGISVGIAASVFAIMYRISRPRLVVLGHVPGTRSYRDIKRYEKAETLEGVLMIRIDESFSFANAEYVRDRILRWTTKEAGVERVILDGSGMNDVDMTGVSVLAEIAKTLERRGIEFFITGLKGPVRDTISAAGLIKRIGEDHLLMTPHRAIQAIEEDEEDEQRWRDQPAGGDSY